MSTPRSNPLLETALAGVPTEFRSRLVTAYVALKDSIREGKNDLAGLNTGKFCEICLRLLQEVVTGSHTAFGKKIDNFADECRKIIAATAPTVVESLRVILPRALVFAYTMRSKRGIGHVGGDIDANSIDVATMARTADWIMCELIRVYHKMSLEEAQDLIDSIATRQMPEIWEVDGKKRVLTRGLTAKQQTLLLLYSEPTNAVLDDDLLSWIEYADLPLYRRDVLRPLHKDRYIEYDESIGVVRLSPVGIAEAERRIRESAGK
jgi:hypothetical protein